MKTDNDFLIGSNGETLAPFLPVRITTREQAFRTAAWIAAMGEVLPREDPDGDRVEFDDVLQAILNT